MKIYNVDNNKKFLALAVCIILTVTFTVSGSLAYFMSITEPAVKTFSIPTNGMSVNSTFDNFEQTDIKIQNTGDVESFIRTKVIVNWRNGTMILPAASNEYTIEYAEDGWKENGGFWYYTSSLGTEASTGVLIKRAVQTAEAPDGYTPEDGFKLNIEIIAQAVPAEPAEAVVSAWGFDPSTL